MTGSRAQLSERLYFCALLPALIIGVLTMRQLGVRSSVWSLNLAAAGVGLLVFAVMTYARSKASRSAWYWAALGSITAILATFTSPNLDGVHRWVLFSGFRLHASSVVAPVLILCVATALSNRLAIGIAVVTALLLALQPDAAQASSFAAACGVVLVRDNRFGRREMSVGVVALLACAAVAFVRADPLTPVRHVEGIFGAVSANGRVCTVLATVALLLLPTPFFAAWLRDRQTLTLALCVYVVLIVIAPTWGTFPVPIMGYGVSPILGYCLALALCVRSTRPAIPPPPR
jgi:cell division protein FtsW (lipid II flippase)